MFIKQILYETGMHFLMQKILSINPDPTIPRYALHLQTV